MSTFVNKNSSSLEFSDSNWICPICNLKISLSLYYCLCGGARSIKSKSPSLSTLPSVLLLEICRLLPYSEVMLFSLLSSFWFNLLASKKARDWSYFPILINIEFSHIVVTSNPYDLINILEKNTIATVKRLSSQVSQMTCWSWEGQLLQNITVQTSIVASPDFVKDKDPCIMSSFSYKSHPQKITRHFRYFDSQKNIHWVVFQRLEAREIFDFCYFWKNHIILTKQNDIVWFNAENGEFEINWKISNIDVNSKIVSIQIYRGFLWILYQDLLLCYNQKGKLLNQYKNSLELIWNCFVIRGNFIILYEETKSCLMIIDRRNERNPIFYFDHVPKHCTQLKLWNNLLFMKGDDCQSVIVFKLIKK